MFTEQQLAAFNAMNHEQIQKRFKEIQDEVNKNDPNTDLEMLQAEFDILQKRDKELKGQVAQRNAFLDTMAKSIEDEDETFVTQQEQARGKAHPSMQERKKGMEDDMEYRSAFMEFVQKGKQSEILRQRSAEAGVAADLGILIPETIVQKVMTELSKSRGYLYNAVLHTNFRGGVKYPIGSFKATFKRITETTVSDRQKAGSVTDFVQFGYLIGEIRLARTLLQTVLTVTAFETKLAEVIVEAYLEAMDREILTGNSANNECEGILTEANKVSGGRIKADHIIEFTEAEMKDWKSWQTKFFAKIPLSMRKLKPEFVMTPATYEANIKTLADQNNRPVYAETFNPIDGAERATFAARIVNFVENDTFKDFNEAQNGEYFGMYWVGKEAYAINSNMQFGVKKYWDYEKNEEVTQALVINDGKVLDPQYIFLLKKKSSLSNGDVTKDESQAGTQSLNDEEPVGTDDEPILLDDEPKKTTRKSSAKKA